MPFLIIIIGLLLVVTAFKGTTGRLGQMLVEEFTGQSSFLYWAVAILVIGAVGYIKPLKGLANSFLVLLIVVLFLSNKGFFGKFSTALKSIASGGAANIGAGI